LPLRSFVATPHRQPAELSATLSRTSTYDAAPSSSFHPVPLFLFAHSPAKRRGGRECREVLPVPSDYGAQVQTGGTITAKPDGWRPIIKIIESQENRLPSDNLYSDYRKPSCHFQPVRSRRPPQKPRGDRPAPLPSFLIPSRLRRPSAHPAILGGEWTTPRHPWRGVTRRPPQKPRGDRRTRPTRARLNSRLDGVLIDGEGLPPARRPSARAPLHCAG